jgi:hypothetical protein
MRKILIIIALIYLSSSLTAQGQLVRTDDSYHSYGIFSNYDYLIHKAHFSMLPDVPNCCPEFKPSYGSGFSIGGVYDYMFPVYGFEARLGLNFINGNFNSNENILMGVNGEPYLGTIEHNIDFDMKNFNLEASFKYILFEKLNLSLGLGSLLYFNSNYSQYEKIIQPKGGVTFLDSNGNDTHKSERNQFSGSLPDLNKLQFYTCARIGYEFPLKADRSLLLKPEAGIDYTLSNMIENLSWNMMSVRLGVSVVFTTAKYMEIKEEKESKYDQYKDLKIEELRNEYEKMQAEKKVLEDSIKMVQNEKKRLTGEISQKDKIIKANIDKDSIQKAAIEIDRQEMNRRIDEENKKTGKICTCYSILFLSSTDKAEADQLVKSLESNGIKDVSISIFTEPYLKQNFYRVKSGCYNNFNEAYDSMQSIIGITDKLNVSTQIICDK